MIRDRMITARRTAFPEAGAAEPEHQLIRE